MESLSTDVLLALPEVFMLAAASIVLLVGLYSGRSSEPVAYVLTLATLVTTAALVYFTASPVKTFAFGGMYLSDPLSQAIKLFSCLTVAAVMLYARPYLRARTHLSAEFYALGLFATMGTLVMASAYNFVLIYLGLELLSLCLYALVAFVRNSLDASEAAIKYFVLGAIASGMLLYGMSIMYGLTGSLDLTEINAYLGQTQANRVALVFALAFIVVGLAFKFGAVPFHMWVPDVYQGAPTAITLFIATMPKFAAFVMAIRLLSHGLQELLVDWQQMLMVLTVLSVVFGNVVAIAQSNIKRMLAYSAISHIGFILLGILPGTDFGYAAAFFYTVIYVLMAAGTFGALILLGDHDREMDQLVDLKGLGKISPWFALILLVLMFSMAGVPLTVGFYAKLYILQSLVYDGLVWVAVLAVVMSVVGAFYYLRVVKYMYFDEAEHSFQRQPSVLAQTVLSVNGLLVVGLFIFPNALLNYCVQVLG
ncbi:MAG: NADH-quinone oxidoreductase subunit NuoN [Gammaproteobacteria bacterium]|nr:NADH-quinone oxidoreductase subunit NuoN [Gammaproteobacteria bacterium]